MLVDLNATTLINNRSVIKLSELIASRGARLKISGNSRDVDVIIDYCIDALRKFNPESRPVDYEVVYQVNDDFTIIGALHDGSLVKSYDSGAICDQFHIDNTMAIFIHHKKAFSMGDRYNNMMVFIPNNLQYKEPYYDAEIFADFLKDKSKAPYHVEGNARQLQSLIQLVHQSCDIVKSTVHLVPSEVDLLNDLLNTYGAFILDHDFNKYDVPEKYLISKKWMDKVRSEIVANPYFIFRHVWRCYFRLCKEGYRFNA